MREETKKKHLYTSQTFIYLLAARCFPPSQSTASRFEEFKAKNIPLPNCAFPLEISSPHLTLAGIRGFEEITLIRGARPPFICDVSLACIVPSDAEGTRGVDCTGNFTVSERR